MSGVVSYQRRYWLADCTYPVVRIGNWLFVLILVAGTVSGAVVRRQHPDRKEWRRSVVGKKAAARIVGGAALGQATNRPRKYGQGVAGFGKRIGTGFVSNAVGRTVEHGVAAKLHEDLHYHPSHKHGVGPRLGYALKSTVVTRDKRSGKPTPAIGKLAGHAASGTVTEGVFAAGSGAATAGIGVAADAGANVVREFVPHRKKYVAGKR